MLGVKLATESRDAATHDGLTTATAQSALPGVKVLRAEGSTIQLHEAAISERLQTVLVIREGEKHRESHVTKEGSVEGRERKKSG